GFGQLTEIDRLRLAAASRSYQAPGVSRLPRGVGRGNTFAIDIIRAQAGAGKAFRQAGALLGPVPLRSRTAGGCDGGLLAKLGRSGLRRRSMAVAARGGSRPRERRAGRGFRRRPAPLGGKAW